MNDEQRQHPRIEKKITIQYCLADANPPKWDISHVENISAGGIKFIAYDNRQDLTNKILYLQIKVQELAPEILQVMALVLSCEYRPQTKINEVRAKFLNLSDQNKEALVAIEKIIESNLKKGRR